MAHFLAITIPVTVYWGHWTHDLRLRYILEVNVFAMYFFYAGPRKATAISVRLAHMLAFGRLRFTG